MTYRVVQWATGLVGKEAIKGVLIASRLETDAIERLVANPLDAGQID